MSIYGHEIDVMQRALIVDKKEYSWRDNLRIELESPNNPLQGMPRFAR